MKKKTLLILAVLITALACLFTSCSASVEPPKAEEEFGYVTFGNGGSRSLTTEYGIKNYDDLYWYYTAVKQDGFGLTGSTGNTETPVPAKTNGKGIGSGTVGPFSQGAWKFTLYAYEENTQTTGGSTTTTKTLVYKGESATIVLKGGETKAVPVSVSLQGATGLVDLSRAYFQWANNSTATGNIYVTVKLTNANGDLTPTILGPLSKTNNNGYQFGSTYLTVNGLTDISADYYTCTINAYLADDVSNSNVNPGATSVATQVMGLRVYGNATTYITGNLVESPDSYVDFTVPQQSMVAFNLNQASVPSNPANAKDSSLNVLPTTIDFGSNLNSGATHILTLEVADIDTSSAKFTVEGDRSAVASLSFDLKAIGTNGSGATTQTPVDTFDTPVTVTTYIAKGLSGVQVKYNGEEDKQPSQITTISSGTSTQDTNFYEAETGKLVFSTTHFSEYYVVSNSVDALNVTTNTAYATLGDAINAVHSNANNITNIKLLRDVTNAEGLSVAKGKNFVVDFNGHTYTLNKPGAGSKNTETNGFQLLKGSTITFKNGTITISEDNKTLATNGKNIKRIIQNYSNLTLENMTIDGTNQYGGASYVMSFNNDSVTISGNTNIIGEEGQIVFDADGNWGSYGRSEVTINTTGKIVGNIEVGQGKLTVLNGNVEGGIVLCTKCGDSETTGQIERISVTGGTFSTDPSDYVPFGYDLEQVDGKYVVSTSTELTVNNTDQLMKFAASVNAGNDYAGKTITLNSNIDLTGKTWVPIGNAENPFRGTFNGVNHKISNLSINGTTNYVGLFGFLDGGIVENIEIQSVSITNTSDDTGAAVGRIENNGKVSNVNILSGSITGNKRTGGVVGTIKAYGTIENCTNAASVTSNTYNAGGIVGAAYYTVSGKEMYIISCTNTGAVTSNGNCAGGIVGLSAANVTGCTNRAKITGSGTSIGGIVGEQKTYGSVTNNTNTGSVENTNNGNYGNGGIIGWLRYHGTGEASSYAVSAIISVTGNKNSGTVSGGNDAGGIIGTVYNSAVVRDNTNEATSLSGTTFAAGIVGNYQTTETPAASEPKSNKLTFAGNTNNTSFDNIEATNKNSLIYTNGNPIITPLAYMDNFSFCEIDSNGTQVGVPVYTTDFSNDVAENFCPYSGHGGANSNSNTHDNFVDSFIVSNGVAEIYRNSAWKHFNISYPEKTYEIKYDLKIDELYNRKTSDGVEKVLGFDFGERNCWESRRLLFAKDGNELKVYLNSFDDTNARTIQAGKVYTITITFSQSIINDEENQKNRLTVNVKVIDPETNSVAFGPVEFTSIGDSPFNSYYWDIYYSIN